MRLSEKRAGRPPDDPSGAQRPVTVSISPAMLDRLRTVTSDARDANIALTQGDVMAMGIAEAEKIVARAARKSGRK